MITRSGYQFQQFEVETKDGYIIQMNGIRNPASFNTVYFQHGVMDSSITWIVHGPSDSIAYQAYEEGYDVFLGNFRGIYPRKVAKWRDPKTYWNYNVDHLAKYDLQAFIETIYKTKIEELKKIYYSDSQLSEEEIVSQIKEKLTITYIGHSLGGMVLPMYVIHQNLQKQPHYLTNAILLSPAGLHDNSPSQVTLPGYVFYYGVSKLISHIAMPNIAIDCI